MVIYNNLSKLVFVVLKTHQQSLMIISIFLTRLQSIPSVDYNSVCLQLTPRQYSVFFMLVIRKEPRLRLVVKFPYACQMYRLDLALYLDLAEQQNLLHPVKLRMVYLHSMVLLVKHIFQIGIPLARYPSLVMDSMQYLQLPLRKVTLISSVLPTNPSSQRMLDLETSMQFLEQQKQLDSIHQILQQISFFLALLHKEHLLPMQDLVVYLDSLVL